MISSSLNNSENIPVLIVSYYYPPINSAGTFRLLGFSKYFLDFGLQPAVITSIPPKRGEFIDSDIAKDIPKVCTVKRIAGLRLYEFENRKNLFIKCINKLIEIFNSYLPIDPYLVWVLPATIQAYRIARKMDCRVVLTSSPPHSSQLVGLILKKVLNIPCIVDFRDPWTANVIREYVTFFDRIIEKLVCKNADVISVVSSKIRDEFVNKYPHVKDKIIVVENGCDLDELKQTIVEMPGSTKKSLRLVYTGEIYPGMAEPLLDALYQIKNEIGQDTNIYLEIAGVIEENTMRRIRELGITDIVRYHGYLSREKCLELVDKADVCLVLLSNNMSGVVTSKLFFYMARRKYILLIAPHGDAAEIVNRTGAGRHILPRTDHTKDMLKKLLVQKINGDLHAEYNEKETFFFSRYSQTQRFTSRIKHIIKQ